MRVTSSLLLFFFLLGLNAQEQQLEVQQVLQPQSFYLNNSTRGALGTGDNITYLPVSLPENTVEWYYSFTAQKAAPSENLDLYSQLVDILDPSGISSSLFETIKVPEGDARCNIYLTDQANAIYFENKQKFKYWPTGSRMNYSQGVVKVEDLGNDVTFLCVENPANWKAVNVQLEVAALVDKSSPSTQSSDAEVLIEGIEKFVGAIQESRKEKRQQGELRERALDYWNAGWVFYESGDFMNSIDYTNKALKLMEHPGLYFNLGLAYWCIGDKDKCTGSYMEGLNLIYGLGSKEEAISLLKGAIQDIEKGESEYQFYTTPPPAQKLLTLKLEKVNSLEKWKDRY